MDKYNAVLKRTDSDGNTRLVKTIAFAFGHTSGLYFKYIEPEKFDYELVSLKKVVQKDGR